MNICSRKELSFLKSITERISQRLAAISASR